MSIANLIPGLKGTGTRRAIDKVTELEALVEELRDDIAKLLNRQAAADDFFAILMNDVVTTNAALDKGKAYRAAVEGAVAQMEMARDDWRNEALALRAQLAPYKAAEANAHRVDVPPMVRDTAAMEDQATAPIDVKPLWEALDVHYAGPAATSPTHVPAWVARDDEPQPAT